MVSAPQYCNDLPVLTCPPLSALSGILFPGNEEAAFSNFRFIESIGSVVAYAISPLLCMRLKLWIMIGIVLTGMSGYSLVELMERRSARRTAPLAAIQEVKLDSDIQRTSF